MYKMI